MRAHHDNLDPPVGSRRNLRRNRLLFRARAAARGVMKSGGEGRQRIVALAWRDESHAEGQAVGAEAGGYGDGRHAAKIHEIGIAAEMGVKPNRIGPHRLDRLDRG